MGKLTQIWRYPIKAVGRERLFSCDLQVGKLIEHDRAWAITHERTSVDPDHPAWAHKMNFINGFKEMTLQAVTSKLNGNILTLEHPKMVSVDFDVTQDGEDICEWARQLIGDSIRPPRDFVHLATGFSDQSEPLISIHNHASLGDLSAHCERAIEVERWRGNLWLDGFGAWEELSWIGQKLRIGEAELEIVEPIGRCNMPMANPFTGEKDWDVLGQLRRHYQHTDFGVFARITKTGHIAESDLVKIID